jgi:hypothetical protein
LKQIVILVGIALLVWVGYSEYQGHKITSEVQTDGAGYSSTISSHFNEYQCDGRTYCSEMNSCEEATYFIQICPNTKMDGDEDGVPCERQWCN